MQMANLRGYCLQRVALALINNGSLVCPAEEIEEAIPPTQPINSERAQWESSQQMYTKIVEHGISNIAVYSVSPRVCSRLGGS